MGKKIAVFDSGLGGITVLSELRKLMPHEDFVYYGDSANAPYGYREDDELLGLCTDLCREITAAHEVKCFVAACNTTSSRVLGRLEDIFAEYNFVGIEPAIERAAEKMPGKNILVLATHGTVHSRRIREKMEGLKQKANFFPLAATGIVPFVENGGIDSSRFRDYLYELLSGYSDTMDAVVLGCTHFPFVKEQIRKCFKKDVVFFDGAIFTARETKRLLEERGWLEPGGKRGSIYYMNSDPSKTELEKMLLKTYESK